MKTDVRTPAARLVGLWAMCRKEALEWRRGAKLWVLAGVIALFAVTGPLTARYTPEILATLADPALAAMAGEPTIADAYQQWAKNLNQLVLLGVIVIAGSSISAEVASGTVVAVLTRSVSRASVVVAKVAVASAIVVVIAVLGAGFTWAMTAFLFGTAPAEPVFAATALWCCAAILLMALAILASAWLKSSMGAIGVGLAGFAVLGIAGLIPWLREHSPAGLLDLIARTASGGTFSSAELWWPVASALVLTGLLVWSAVAVFERREV